MKVAPNTQDDIADHIIKELVQKRNQSMTDDTPAS